MKTTEELRSAQGPGSIESGLYRVSTWLGALSATALCLMMLVTVVDVGGRYLFNKPLYGAYELIGMLLVAAGPLGMALCQKDRRHIVVSLVVDMLPRRTQEVINTITLFLSLVAYSIITWQMLRLTVQYWMRGRGGVSPDLGISLSYVSIVFAIGALLFTLVLLLHFVQSLWGLKRR
ncbi:MAG: TRAP transporter small permease [Deltaproteobacteria bacterium]|nr:TRAP transporter small permease [Deltaproteobacteria bacterium]